MLLQVLKIVDISCPFFFVKKFIETCDAYQNLTGPGSLHLDGFDLPAPYQPPDCPATDAIILLDLLY